MSKAQAGRGHGAWRQAPHTKRWKLHCRGRFLCVAVAKCFAQWRNVLGHDKALAVPRARAEVEGITRKEREYKEEASKTKAEVA